LSWATLRALWDERDNRYRYLKGVRQLDVRAAESVRAYRWTEVALLPAIERPFAVATLNGWLPPAPIR
jgi:hypothetical protein